MASLFLGVNQMMTQGGGNLVDVRNVRQWPIEPVGRTHTGEVEGWEIRVLWSKSDHATMATYSTEETAKEVLRNLWYFLRSHEAYNWVRPVEGEGGALVWCDSMRRALR